MVGSKVEKVKATQRRVLKQRAEKLDGLWCNGKKKITRHENARGGVREHMFDSTY